MKKPIGFRSYQNDEEPDKQDELEKQPIPIEKKQYAKILVSFENVLPKHQSYKKSTRMKLRKSQLLNNVCLPDLVP